MQSTHFCSVDGCDRTVLARGACRRHYERIRKYGTTDLPQRWPSPAERLASKLLRMPNGCLEWTGSVGSKGYGAIRANGKNVKTHRLAWELANGPIPDGLHVLHHCDNPPCCETAPSEEYPEGHLFLGTNADNNADMMAKGRFVSGWALINPNAIKTHCPQRHEYTEANTYHYRNGRYCRACNSVYVARYKARRQAITNTLES